MRSIFCYWAKRQQNLTKIKRNNSTQRNQKEKKKNQNFLLNKCEIDKINSLQKKKWKKENLHTQPTNLIVVVVNGDVITCATVKSEAYRCGITVAQKFLVDSFFERVGRRSIACCLLETRAPLTGAKFVIVAVVSLCWICLQEKL